MINVLSVASEAIPLIKTGGLADVVGALPEALTPFDVRMRVLLPAYPAVKKHIKRGQSVWSTTDLFGGAAHVTSFNVGKTEFLALYAPHLFDRDGGPYLDQTGVDYSDNAERFAALSMVAACIADEGLKDGWCVDVVHMHDWQTALSATYMKSLAKRPIPSVITIHNIAFQGYVPADKLETLQLPVEHFTPAGFEYYGKINMLKAGLTDADLITTVSKTYANELKTPEFGMGLDGLIRARQDALEGILNGVDLNEWNPENAPYPYNIKKISPKTKNREALLKTFNLPKQNGPLAIVVSRLTEQKGIDLLLKALPDYFYRGGALVLLGSGNPYFEAELSNLARAYPKNFSLQIGYNEPLSRQMFAGGDAVLVPSRFEPCGLTQLYGLRYGALPVVTNTGGLADTVINANQVAIDKGVATGIVMTRIDTEALKDALTHLIELYRNKTIWRKMQKNAMSQSVGWNESAQQYAKLYKRALSSG